MDGFYNFNCIRATTAQLLNVFNGMSIRKFDKNGQAKFDVDVPLYHLPKEKYHQWLFSNRNNKHLPSMSLQMTSLDFSSERLTNPNFKIHRPSGEDDGSLMEIFTPTPYDISFQLNIATKYNVEANQILEQILPWFQPFIMTRIKIPGTNLAFDVKVLLTGVTPDAAVEIDMEDFRIINWSIDLTAQSYTMKPIKMSKFVKTIAVPFYTENENFENGSNGLEINKNDKTISGSNSNNKPNYLEYIHAEINEIDEIIISHELIDDFEGE